LVLCRFERHRERNEAVDVVGSVGFVDASASSPDACDRGGGVLA
jgi:hypothetical protein